MRREKDSVVVVSPSLPHTTHEQTLAEIETDTHVSDYIVHIRKLARTPCLLNAYSHT